MALLKEATVAMEELLPELKVAEEEEWGPEALSMSMDFISEILLLRSAM
jgi:hypothetical protein